MAQKDTVLFIIILAVVILSLALVVNWSMTFLIVFGMLVYGILTMTSGKPESFTFQYDVFLNVRDPIDELGDLLYHSFQKCGIKIYADRQKLFPGDYISQEVKEVIKQSRISIAIISPRYVSGRRCLDELEQMWECRELQGQEIIPIFFGVSPTEVENQTGIFEQAFNLRKNEIDSNTIERWKEVLQQIGRLKGYRSDEWLVEEIAKKVVLRVLHVSSNHRVEPDAGIDDQVEEMMKKLDVDYREGQVVKVSGKGVCIVGICGAYVGKTTLAKRVFSKIHERFDACSFLRGIHSKGHQFSREMLIADLQKLKLAPSSEGIKEIASAKVLIVLDDVRKDKQIKELVGKFNKFGRGSRIIVTTNDENVLKAFKVGEEANRWNFKNVLKAFKVGEEANRWKVRTYKVEDVSNCV